MTILPVEAVAVGIPCESRYVRINVPAYFHNHNRILSAPDSLSHVLATLRSGSSEGVRRRGGRGMG